MVRPGLKTALNSVLVSGFVLSKTGGTSVPLRVIVVPHS